MKIGIQIEHFDRRRGGAETYAASLCEALVRDGHEIHVFSRSANEQIDGVTVHDVKAVGLANWQKTINYGQHADTVAAEVGVDVVLGFGASCGMDVLQPHGGTRRGSQRQNLVRIDSSIARALKGISNGFSPKHTALLHLEAKQFAQRPRPQIVAISRMVAADMKQFYRVTDDDLHVIYNGVDSERFDPNRVASLRDDARATLGLDRGAIVFALAANNFALKGVAELVRAAEILHRDGHAFTIVIAGKGRAEPFMRQAKILGCAEHIRFIGPVDDITPIYAAADVYVQPTWYDPCSLVVFEAMAAGLPVITTRFNGAGELIEDGCHGYIIDTPRNTERLADVMVMCMDKDAQKTMGAAARSAVEPYTWDRNCREMVRVFQLAAEKEGMSTK